MKNVHRLLDTYQYLLKILMKNSPGMVLLVFFMAALSGFIAPFAVYVNSNIFNLALKIAKKEAEFSALFPFLVLFVLCTLTPNLINLWMDGIASPRSMLILRSAFRGEMLQKLKRMKYEHLESEKDMEIIDKAYSRAENSARHLFPMYINYALSSLVGALGSLYLIVSIQWWLIFPILLPFIIEMILTNRSSYNIYVELESYWKKEKQYEMLEKTLQNRDYVRENRLNQSSNYLVDTYQKRMSMRNQEYEKFFFKNLRKVVLSSNFSRFSIIVNVLILLYLYLQGQINIGLFISMSLLIFNSLYEQLGGSVYIFKWGHYHANFFDYYLNP